jgi:glycosyltransferase involved in cell wall biosynthesis
MTGPDVSAIIPAYNAGRFISDAIESVLAQTHSAMECIVVDDGSTDDTASVAESHGPWVTVIRQANAGVSAARNAGAQVAKGRYLAFLDADDAWLPTKIEKQIQRARSGSFGLISGGFYVTDEVLQPLYEVPVPDDDVAFLNAVSLVPPGTNVALTGFVPVDVFFEAGGFDERLSVSADLDLVLQIALNHNITCIPEPLALYRQHGVQMSDDYERMEFDATLLLEKFYASSQLPPEIKGRRSESFANLHLMLAAGHVADGRFPRGLSHLTAAARHSPSATARGLIRGLRRKYRRDLGNGKPLLP